MEVYEPEHVGSLLLTLESEFSDLGFEFHAFKIGWYNSCVQPSFALDYDDDIVAVVVVSTPSMFEKVFVPFVHEKYMYIECLRDPIDECMINCFSKMKDVLPFPDIKIIHDFELHSNRKPKVLMQTAAHVSGAAYFYQRNELKEDLFDSKKLYGVCIHPKYGGWFALRGVLIFTDLKCPGLHRIIPKDVLQSDEQKIELLKKYNFHWQDWTYRDVIPVIQKYSIEQIKYFSALPAHRVNLITKLCNSKSSSYL